jgi:hypothetical protein
MGVPGNHLRLKNICSNPLLSRTWQFFFYSTHSGGEIDLILDNGQKRIAVEFKASASPEISQKFPAILQDIEFDSVWVVAPVSRMYQLHGNINMGSIKDFFELSGVL